MLIDICAFWAFEMHVHMFIGSYTTFYNFLGALHKKRVTIESALQVKPGQTLTFPCDVCMVSLLISGCANCLKIHHGGEINKCGSCTAGIM